MVNAPGPRSVVVLLSLGLAAGATGCGPDPPAPTVAASPAAPAPSPRPDIVLVTIDTLRRDRVSAYGYEYRTTPFIDSLAAEGVRFDRVQSTSSWTVPAVASMLSGLEPAGHGVISGLVTEEGEVVGQQVLGEDLLLLPEALREHGYVTVAVTANGHLHEDFGFAQGFDEFRCLGFATADRVNHAVLDVVGDRARARPLFLWVHYFDPHDPYLARPRFERFLDSDEPVDALLKERLISLPEPAEFRELLVREGVRGERYLAALYDSEVHWVDAAVRVLLHDAGLNDALVLVTSDHGEEFLDHGDLWHGHTLFEELVAVPLIVRFPGRLHAGAVVRHRGSLIDLLPTVLDFLGMDRPVGIDGGSLMPVIRGETPPPVAVRASLRLKHDLESVTLEDWKLIRDEGTGESLLLNLSEDPAESRDLGPRRPDRLIELQQLLDSRAAGRAAEPSPEIVHLSAERLAHLRSLGYVD